MSLCSCQRISNEKVAVVVISVQIAWIFRVISALIVMKRPRPCPARPTRGTGASPKDSLGNSRI